MKRLLVSLALLGSLLQACQDKEPAEGADSKIYFTGITRVDQNGSPTAYPDTTDWRTDDQWTQQESALFASSQPFQCGTVDSAEIYAASPNPCKGKVGIGFSTGSNITWRFRLVDEDFNLLDSLDWHNPPVWYNSIVWEMDSFPRDTVRLYYQIEKQGCMMRGHGDILIED